MTEELEESPESTVYDDYKFVTRKDLENLGETLLPSFLVKSSLLVETKLKVVHLIPYVPKTKQPQLVHLTFVF